MSTSHGEVPRWERVLVALVNACRFSLFLPGIVCMAPAFAIAWPVAFKLGWSPFGFDPNAAFLWMFLTLAMTFATILGVFLGLWNLAEKLVASGEGE